MYQAFDAWPVKRGDNTKKLSLGWPKGGCDRLMMVELYVMIFIYGLHSVKHNIEASLRDRGGLFFCDPRSFLVIFFITLPFEGFKN